MAGQGLLRIGELSRRSGVSPELLRAWERRYELLTPSRSEGGLRLYSESDLERVRAMQRPLPPRVAAADAARPGRGLRLSSARHLGRVRAIQRHPASALPAAEPARLEADAREVEPGRQM